MIRIRSSPHLQTVAYIASVGYSGSTLLDLLLGSHREISAVGEVALLAQYARANSRCTCGQRLSECSFWLSIEEGLKKRLGNQITLSTFHLTPWEAKQSMFRKIPTLTDVSLLIGNRYLWRGACAISGTTFQFRQCAINAALLFEEICAQQKTRIIIDSSKYALPFKAMRMEIGAQLKVIYLIRDGRAVCKSLMNRQSLTMEQAAKHWRRYNINLQLMLATLPKKSVCTLNYETLCLHPDKVNSRLAKFLGVENPIQERTLVKEDHHDIGGNPMRFRRNEVTIQYDDEWKRILTNDQLETFERIAGRLNRRLGYSD